MANANGSGDRATMWIRGAARGIGSFVAAFWLFVGIVAGIYESGPWTLESAILAGLIIASVLSVLVAWWREGVGGLLVVICAVAHGTFAYVASGHNKVFAMLFTSGPLLVPGVLFLAGWCRSRRSNVPQVGA